MKATQPLPVLLFTALCVFVPSLAHAHAGHEMTFGFGQGFQHPLGGLDHLLAMVAVGLWAAQIGGSALWALPLSFVGVLTIGATLGLAGIAVPAVEPGILASVLVLGLLIAFAVRLPLAASVTLVGVFALFHGFAHGAEMPVSASGTFYAMGFVLATASLHFAGVALGLIAKNVTPAPLVRFAGASIVAIGIAQAIL